LVGFEIGLQNDCYVFSLKVGRSYAYVISLWRSTMCSIDFLYVFDVAQIDEKSRVTDAFITSHNKVKADFFLVNEADRYIVCLLVEVKLEDHKC